MINKNNLKVIERYFAEYFGKYSVHFQKSLTVMIVGIMHSMSCSTGEILTRVASIFGKTFRAAEKQVSYLYSNSKFQVDDTMWRCYIKLIFNFLLEGNYIKKEGKTYIQIDQTTIKDKFVILYASIVFRGKAVPIYFSIRLYPTRKKQLDLVKMERAFFVRLNHCLSKIYSYVIVADRGFGNARIARYCREFGFDYILRIKNDIRVGENGLSKLSEYKTSKSIKDIYIYAWKKRENIIIKKTEDAIWYIVSSLDLSERKTIIREYERRFKIEKCFFDQKSNGFNIEKLKITKYSRVKRMIFCICITQALVLFSGDVIKHNHHTIKKTFPETVDLILAFSPLLNE